MARILAVVTAFAVTFAPTVYALDFRAEDQVADDEICVSDFVVCSEENSNYKAGIDQQDMEQLKQYLDQHDNAADEICAEVFSELGFSDNAIAAIGIDELADTLDGASTITVSQQYFIVGESGEKEVVELHTVQSFRLALAAYMRQEGGGGFNE